MGTRAKAPCGWALGLLSNFSWTALRLSFSRDQCRNGVIRDFCCLTGLDFQRRGLADISSEMRLIRVTFRVGEEPLEKVAYRHPRLHIAKCGNISICSVPREGRKAGPWDPGKPGPPAQQPCRHPIHSVRAGRQATSHPKIRKSRILQQENDQV
jgi:hypothetical protein